MCEYCNDCGKGFCRSSTPECKGFKKHLTRCQVCDEKYCKNSSKWCNDCEKYYCDDECYDSIDHKSKCLYCERMYCHKEHKCDKDYLCCSDGICKKCVSKLDKYTKLRADYKASKAKKERERSLPSIIIPSLMPSLPPSQQSSKWHRFHIS